MSQRKIEVGFPTGQKNKRSDFFLNNSKFRASLELPSNIMNTSNIERDSNNTQRLTEYSRKSVNIYTSKRKVSSSRHMNLKGTKELQKALKKKLKKQKSKNSKHKDSSQKKSNNTQQRLLDQHKQQKKVKKKTKVNSNRNMPQFNLKPLQNKKGLKSKKEKLKKNIQSSKNVILKKKSFKSNTNTSKNISNNSTSMNSKRKGKNSRNFSPTFNQPKIKQSKFNFHSNQAPITKSIELIPIKKPFETTNGRLSYIEKHQKKNKKKIQLRNPSVHVLKKNQDYNKEIPFLKEIRSISQTNSINMESSVSNPSKIDYNMILEIQQQSLQLPNFSKAKVILENQGPIWGLVATTHQGIVRNSNEDRVSILLNAQEKFIKYKDKNNPIKFCSLFSVLDGHGGTVCSNYLRENLHQKILNDFDYEDFLLPQFERIYQNLDKEFLKIAEEKKHKFSGSCACSIIILNNSLLVVNVGDSRAILSVNRGEEVKDISKDHKPSFINEFSRIIQSGGELYCRAQNLKSSESVFFFAKNYSELKQANEQKKRSRELLFGPWRIKPGGLSVARSFGDLESKVKTFGGKENIVVSKPEIFDMDIESNFDFAFIASDGIYDVLSSKQIVKIIWNTIEYHKKVLKDYQSQIEFILSECVNNVLKKALIKQSDDNVTGILICFKDLFLNQLQ